MTVTTERPTERPTDLPADSRTDSIAGATVLEEPSSRTALRKRPKGRHRAAAVVRADSVPGEMSHGEILRAMTGLLAALFTAMLSSTIVATALPTIIGDLQGTQSQYTWIITASLLATTVTTPIWGKLADLFSKKVLVQSATVVFVLGSVAAGMAHNVPFLIACRVVQGIGMGGLTALAAAIMGAIVAPRERGRYSGYMGAVMAVATVSGPLLGGFVVDSWGWRWTLLHLRPARDRRDLHPADPAPPAHGAAAAEDRLPGRVPHRRHRESAAALGDLRGHRLRLALVAVRGLRRSRRSSSAGSPSASSVGPQNRWYR